jgi:hypothetical protein
MKRALYPSRNDGLMTMLGQAKKMRKENWYFKLEGSYFTQTAATEFPVVST